MEIIAPCLSSICQSFGLSADKPVLLAILGDWKTRRLRKQKEYKEDCLNRSKKRKIMETKGDEWGDQWFWDQKCAPLVSAVVFARPVSGNHVLADTLVLNANGYNTEEWKL